jgi:PhnB protein
MSTQPVPPGFHTVTPFLTLADAPRFIDFAARAFGAREVARVMRPGGGVRHAQIEIGDSRVMMGEANGEWKAMQSFLHLYVPDVDALYARAVRAGAVSMQAPSDQPWGDRMALVKDPFGNLWGIATHVGISEA